MIIGIDLGSRFVKIALAAPSQGWPLIKYRIFDTIHFYQEYCRPGENGFVINFKDLGLEADQVVACGYGRQAAAISGAVAIPEIQAHALGVRIFNNCRDFLLIDLGGQDSKIILVKNGQVADFSTNDKCAAGSGRYLENAARTLDLSLAEFGNYWQNPEPLSSTCAVFGESELVGKIITGVPLGNLAAGANLSVVLRILPLISRYSPTPHIYFSGGVAANAAIHKLLEENLGQKVTVLPDPQYNGARGCFFKAWQSRGQKPEDRGRR
ncbi:MAG: acyl-CoA dehydratase activase [Clostridiales bacterium]|nr:acyl-CoA dehydratase activase [Clostridiales bacterium]